MAESHVRKRMRRHTPTMFRTLTISFATLALTLALGSAALAGGGGSTYTTAVTVTPGVTYHNVVSGNEFWKLNAQIGDLVSIDYGLDGASRDMIGLCTLGCNQGPNYRTQAPAHLALGSITTGAYYFIFGSTSTSLDDGWSSSTSQPLAYWFKVSVVRWTSVTISTVKATPHGSTTEVLGVIYGVTSGRARVAINHGHSWRWVTRPVNAQGRFAYTFPTGARGKIAVKAAYAGDASHQASASRTASITIR